MAGPLAGGGGDSVFEDGFQDSGEWRDEEEEKRTPVGCGRVFLSL